MPCRLVPIVHLQGTRSENFCMLKMEVEGFSETFFTVTTCTPKMEIAASCKTFAPINQTTQCHILEDHNINITTVKTSNLLYK